MSYYKAKVTWYYNDNENTEFCLTFGENYTQAMQYITSFYGEENLEEVKLSWLYDEPVLPASEETINLLETY